jgi:lipoprotein-anchoring transpeptidase ErfK/SrfK
MTKNNSGTSIMLAKGISVIFGAAALALLSSCASWYPYKQASTAMTPKPAPAKPAVEPKRVAKAPPLYEWNGDGHKVSRIEISVNEQKARFYDGNQEIGWTTVASGVRKHPTPVGNFAVLEKAVKKTSNVYGRIYDKHGRVVVRDAKLGRDPIPPGGHFKGAKMPFFLRLTNDGIAMHAGPIPHPGRRASHGCVRMPRAFAPILYREVSLGTPVSVEGNGPSYATYIAQERAAAARLAAAKARKAKPAAGPAPGTAPSESPAPGHDAQQQLAGAGSANGATASTPNALPAASLDGSIQRPAATVSTAAARHQSLSPTGNAVVDTQGQKPAISADSARQSPSAAPAASSPPPSPPATAVPPPPASSVTGPPKTELTPSTPAGAAASPKAADRAQSPPQREG